MALANSRTITTGRKFTCFAPEYITKYNKKKNREVMGVCYQTPKFYPRPSCVDCRYHELEDPNES